MGWLDELQAYMAANTPRNTRPAVSPFKVIDQGLLGNRVSDAPDRAQTMHEGLLRVPADLKQLTSPEMFKRVNDAYEKQPAKKKKPKRDKPA